MEHLAADPHRASEAPPAPAPESVSLLQRIRWLRQAALPDVPCYQEALAVAIDGDLDVGLFAQAFDTVVERSEALRTGFDVSLIDVARRVAEAPTLELPELVAELDLDAWAADRLARPLGLDGTPPLDAVLHRTLDGQTIWYLAWHRAHLDLTSIAQLYHDVAAVYAHLRDARAGEAAGRARDYRCDDAVPGASGAQAAAPAFYRGLPGAPALDEHRRRLRIEGERAEGLTLVAAHMADDHGLEPLLPVFGAAVACLLAGLGHGDVSLAACFDAPSRRVPAPLGQRERRIPVRIAPRGDLPLIDIVREVARRLGEAQGSPGEVDAHVQLEVWPAGFGVFAGLPARARRLHPGRSDGHNSVRIVVRPEGAAIDVDLHLNTGAFDADEADRFARHLERTLAELVTTPEQPLRDLSLPDANERREILTALDGGADTGARAPLGNVVSLFDAHVRRAPRAPAVEGGRTRLSYGDLAAEVDVLVAHLVRRGIGPGQVVVVSASASAQSVAAVLAVLKAGAILMPLDPAVAPARAEVLLREARAQLMLTERRLVGRFSVARVPMVAIDALVSSAEADAPPVELMPVYPACIVYDELATEPGAGIVLTARTLSELALACQAEAAPHAPQRTLHLAPPGQLRMIVEIFTALFSGGTLVLPQTDARRLEHALLETLDGQRVERLICDAGDLEALAAAATAAGRAPRGLRDVVFEGDVLPRSPAVRWFFDELAGVRISHWYGPPEAPMALVARLDALPREATVPRLVPARGARAYLLDANGQPVPRGVAGRLFIGGTHVAQGYLDAAEATLARFLGDPFEVGGGSRLFDTGRCARLAPDGQLELLGEMDAGPLRLRLAVEAELCGHPEVADARVSLGPGGPVASVLPHRGTPRPHALHVYLERRLPAALCPVAYARVHRLPPSEAEGVWERAIPVAEGPFERPRNERELHLARVWAYVLERGEVGVHDRFEELGGDSLAAIRIVRVVEHLYRERLPLAVMRRIPTIAQLAAYLQRTGTRRAGRLVVPIQPSGTRPPVFVVGTPWGDVATTLQDVFRALSPEQPVYGLACRAAAGYESMSVAQLASRCVAAMRRVQPVGPYLLAGAGAGSVVAFEMARQLAAAEADVGLLFVLPDDGASAVEVVAAPGMQPSVRVQAARRSPAPAQHVRRQLRRLYLHTGREVPDDWQHGFETDQIARALEAYQPRPLPGRIVFVRRRDGAAAQTARGWAGLATEGIQHVAIEAEGPLYGGDAGAEVAAALEACVDAVVAFA